MTNAKNKTKRIMLVSIMMALALVMTIVIVFTGQRGGLSAHAMSPSGQAEQRIFSNATIDDYFADDSILVVLNREATFNFDIFAARDFSGMNVREVSNLTKYTEQIVQQQLVAERTGNWDNLRTLKDRDMLVETNSFRTILRLELGKNCKENVLRYIDKLSMRPDIIYAGPNFMHERVECPIDSFGDFEPFNDGTNQWAADLINAPAARTIHAGSADIMVGILDTGVNGNHALLRPQLENRLHMEFSGGNREVATPVPADSGTHGTMSAGVVNLVSQNVNIVSLRINEGGSWFSDNVVLAVNYAARMGIQVLNYSGRTRCRRQNIAPFNDPVLEQAIRNFGGIFVVSAGNHGADNDVQPNWPTNYSLTLNNVISVGAIDRNSARSVWGGATSSSCWGANSVNIFAPGGRGTAQNDDNIRLVSATGGWWFYNGTSAAAPFVAGTVALMLSVNPALQQNPLLLRNTLVNAGAPITINVTNGTQVVRRLDAYAAVRAARDLATPLDFEIIGNTNNVRVRARQGATLPADLVIPSTVVIGGITRTVTEIAANAFAGASSVMNVTIPSTVTTIGASAFANTSITELHIPNSVNYVAANAFAGVISLRTIRMYGLTPVHVPRVNAMAFSGVNRSRVTLAIPSGGTRPFENAGWTGFNVLEITVDGTMFFTPVAGFDGRLIIPNGVTYIGTFTFFNESARRSIVEITIPSSVTSISNEAFGSLWELRTIINNSVIPQEINSSTFSNVSRYRVVVFVPYGTYQVYRDAGWTGFNLIDPVVTDAWLQLRGAQSNDNSPYMAISRSDLAGYAVKVVYTCVFQNNYQDFVWFSYYMISQTANSWITTFNGNGLSFTWINNYSRLSISINGHFSYARLYTAELHRVQGVVPILITQGIAAGGRNYIILPDAYLIPSGRIKIMYNDYRTSSRSNYVIVNGTDIFASGSRVTMPNGTILSFGWPSFLVVTANPNNYTFWTVRIYVV